MDTGAHVEDEIAAADNNTVVNGLEGKEGTQFQEGETGVNTCFGSFGDDLKLKLQNKLCMYGLFFFGGATNRTNIE